jgi:hypothetical protein
MWPWVPAGLDARSGRAGWLPAVSFYSAGRSSIELSQALRDTNLLENELGSRGIESSEMAVAE